MKWWMGVLNLLASAFIIYLVIIAHNQIEIHERDFQSEVLAQAIDTANGYAFRNSLYYSNLDQEYDDLQTMTLDPTNVLRDFEIMMCICYGMSLSNENMELVASCIDGGILCDSDGYYVLKVIEQPILMDETVSGEDYKYYYENGVKKSVGKRVYVTNDTETFAQKVSTPVDRVKTHNVRYTLGWSTKVPYAIKTIAKIRLDGIDEENAINYDSVPEVEKSTYAMNLTNANTYKYSRRSGKGRIERQRHSAPERRVEEREYMHHGEPVIFEKIVSSYDNYYPRDDYMYNMREGKVFWTGEYISDETKYKALNNLLASELNNSIKNILEARGIQMNYSVYLPASTTQSGVNPIKSNTLLISMSKASFAGKYAYLSEPILAGHRAVDKEYIVEYVDKVDGVRRYCYASQLPVDKYPLEDRKEMYYSEYDAVMAGCKPGIEYITRPLLRELQSID